MNHSAENNQDTEQQTTPSKSDLLQQLKIDRSAPEEPEQAWLKTGVGKLLIGTSLIMIFGIFYLNLSKNGAEDPKLNQDNLPINSADSTPIKNNSNEDQGIEPATSRSNLPSTSILSNEAILNASGYITPRRMATVSAEIMGLITSVKVEEGMKVTQGDVLATLDNTLAKINLDLAKAQLQTITARRQSVEASLREAQRQYKRVTSNSYSSESAISGAQTNLESLQANLASETANLQVAKLEVKRQQERFNDHTIRAPFDGVVTVKNAQPGEIVAPSSAGGGFTRTGICTLVDMTSLEIEVDVNESFIGRVYPGQKVRANLDAYPDWDIPATVVAIIPTADRAKATVRVRIGIDQKDAKILPDMGVKVAFLKQA